MAKSPICWVSLNGYSWLQIGCRHDKFTSVTVEFSSLIVGRIGKTEIFGLKGMRLFNIRQRGPT